MKSFFLKSRYGLIPGVLAVLFAAFFILEIKERYTVRSIVDEERKRHLADLSLEEFRIRSRDMTRYARSYCATENQVYYDRYASILQWNRGEIPRTARLGSSISSHFEGRKISQGEILDDIGLTDEEKKSFLKAEELRNILAEQELQAMESIRNGAIVPGPQSPIEGETVPEFVNRVLYGESYHNSLGRIADNADDCMNQYRLRTNALFEAYRNVFSFGLFMQFLIQIALVASVIFLILYLMTRMRRQHEESRQLMLDAMPIGCMIRDSRFNLINCNQEMLRMLGLKDTKDAAEHFLDRSPEFQPNGKRTKDYAREVQNKAFESGFEQFRWAHFNGNGQEFPAEVTLVRINQRNEDFTVAYTRDVSEEEAAAREIINSEARILAYQEAGNRMQQMLDAIPVGIALFDADFKLEDCNNVEMKLFGMDKKEEFKKRFFELSPKYQPNGRLSRELMDEKLASVEEHTVQSFEWIHMKADGTTFPTEVTISRVQSGDRKILAICNRDLTEEKMMQAKVAQVNERIRLMFDSTPLCCTLLDEDFNGIDCNWAAVNLYGMSDKEEYLPNFHKIFPEYQPNGFRSIDFFREKVKEALQKGRVDFEGMTQNMQGEEIPVEIVFIPLLVNNDKPTIAGYARDLRERKLLEKTEALSEIKMRFLANMSHEIRTPMNAIVALSDLLMDERLNEKQNHYVVDIKSSADTLLTLINDLLDFSKLEAGKMQLVPRHYNFNELIDNVSSTLGFAAKNKGLDFILEKKGDLPEFLFGDNVRLKQILWNFIGNAVKFTENGFVKLVITDCGEQLRFDVIDSGVGIKESDIPYLFEAFMQATQNNTAHVQGTGLGLVICKSIAELMGGEIHVSSSYGNGSTFSFSIPKVLGDASQIENHDSAHELIVESSAKILVVDDNAINLNVATGVFGSLGIEIDTASSGREALRMIRQTDYDIVFMDHMMPEMDGVETTQRIRALGGKYATLPVIALTANAVHGVKEMLINSGMNEFISKPIDKMELNRVLMEFLPKESYRIDTIRKPQRLSEPDRSQDELKTLMTDGVPDLNVALGMTRSGGNWDAFITSLKMLNRKLPEHIDRMAQLLTDEAIQEYAIEVHGIKGVLAGLGCDLLSADAAELERAAKSGNITFCLENTEVFTEKLNQLNDDLTAVFKITERRPENGKKQGQLMDLASGLEKIGRFLDDYDTDSSMALTKNMREYRFESLIEQKLARLEELIEEFDHDAAKQLIQELGTLSKNTAGCDGVS